MKTNQAGKEQARFCEFTSNAVHYFMRASQVGFGIEQRGTIVLTKDTTIIVDQGAITIETPQRTWCLKTDDDVQLEEWSTLLVDAVNEIKRKEGVATGTDAASQAQRMCSSIECVGLGTARSPSIPQD